MRKNPWTLDATQSVARSHKAAPGQNTARAGSLLLDLSYDSQASRLGTHSQLLLP
jgi:hypothetical protein